MFPAADGRRLDGPGTVRKTAPAGNQSDRHPHTLGTPISPQLRRGPSRRAATAAREPGRTGNYSLLAAEAARRQLRIDRREVITRRNPSTNTNRYGAGFRAARIWADRAADLVFGSGLEHRRLFPGRLARGHPAARAHAFLRARISAALFSRAIYGMSSA